MMIFLGSVAVYYLPAFIGVTHPLGSQALEQNAPYSQIVSYTGRMRPIVENDVTIHPSWTTLELEISCCHMFQ